MSESNDNVKSATVRKFELDQIFFLEESRHLLSFGTFALNEMEMMSKMIHFLGQPFAINNANSSHSEKCICSVITRPRR